MNVLQILPELNVGGVERGTVDFAKYLIEQGHASIVVSSGGTLVPELKRGGSKHYALAVDKKNLWTMFRMIKPLRDIIRKENIDIVHARSRVPAWIAYLACRRTKASFITTCHGYYNGRFLSQVMGWSKLVITPSEVIARHMIDDFKVPSQHFRVIPRSVDLTKFLPKKEESRKKTQYTIAIVGRLTPLKGHTYFLKAMARVVRSIPYAKIWIIGDAPEKKPYFRQELEMQVKRLGLKDHVEFLGNRKDIAELLAKSDVLAFSSITPESFGRVIIEAQAVGVPVVATSVGGVVDIIDHEQTGLLVMPKDSEAMADAIIRVLNDKGLVERMVKAARVKIKNNFTVKHMASRTLEVYEELLQTLNVLVIKISSIGDVILITAALKAIRKKFPRAGIYCLVGKASRQVIQNCPYLDGLIIYDTQNKDKGWFRFFKLSCKLREYKFDKVIDFQNNRKSHLLSFLSFPKESYGYDNGKWGNLLSNPIKDINKHFPAVKHQFQVLKQLNIPYKKDVYLKLWPSEGDRRCVDSLLDAEWLGNTKNIVGINIAASEKWQTKNWPVEYMANVCDALAAKNVRVIITGMDKDKPALNALLSLTKSRPAVFVGRTNIIQLAVLIQKCKVFLTPDSAPMHIAAAMNVPVIALFGPTSSSRHIPPAKTMVVLEKKPACAPCYSSRCPILTHACMKDITPQEVIKQIDQLMEVQA